MTALDIATSSTTKPAVSAAEPVPMPRLTMPASCVASNGVPLNTPPLSPSPWRDIATRKCEDRASRLRAYSQWSLGAELPSSSQKNVISLVHTRLTRRERSFLALDVTSLAGRLAVGECTSVEVTTAFCKAAYAAQELTNCLTEIMFTQALVRAQELDDHLAETGQVVGPLHGVPVSIKDHVLVKGEDTATGYIAWAGRTVADRDACVVQILRAAGAIIYVKTANPQSLLCLETSNNIYGYTTNPFNRDLSPGGSSGGEGALIACRGSLMGVGTDIGGSIRCVDDQAWSGLYGFKPSVARMPHTGLLGSHDGMDNIVGVVGPLAHSARDLELFCRVMSQYESWTLEHQILNMPWNQTVAQSRGEGLPKRLVIGILSDDGVVAPHPPIAAQLQKTRAALLAAGHEVIDWIPMEHQEAWDLIVKLYLLDGGKEYRATLAESGEPAMPLVEWMLSHAAGRGPYSVDQIWALNVAREQFRARGLRHWNASASRSEQGRAFDAVLCPVAPTLASPHDTTRWWGYSSYWNLLDLPAVVFPSGKPLDATTWDRSQETALPVARNAVEEFVRNQWDANTYNGAPVSLQLVGRRLHEEKVLAILNVVEDAVARFENAGSEILES
ncbi:fatty-acid amide hydrolase [Rhizoctonia solani AG-1 IB]|uniref:Fatty-acid amide hydrolase n=1 Tax=Thanatephorus cucumeris (strain AG1-IB / isolate 7/3/14) TaxID=1108050 RepID=A0A0B7FDI0_THACB|nr:fatty-acid amide hydrolase [Rhizoctonia solani AG-1 IB]